MKLILAVASLTLICLATTIASSQKSSNTNDAEFKTLIDRYYAAWSSLNPDNAAPFYAKDADLVFLVLRLGQAHYFAGNPERAGELIERGLDLAEALQLPEHLCRGWTSKAALISPRRPEEARSLFQLALDHALAHELYTQAAAACASLADLALRRDQYSESLEHLDQALAIARRIGHRPYEWFTASEASYALTMLGRWDEALARFGEIPDEQIGKDTT